MVHPPVLATFLLTSLQDGWTYRLLALVDDRLECLDLVVHQHAPRAFCVHELLRAHLQVLAHALHDGALRVVYAVDGAARRRRPARLRHASRREPRKDLPRAGSKGVRPRARTRLPGPKGGKGGGGAGQQPGDLPGVASGDLPGSRTPRVPPSNPRKGKRENQQIGERPESLGRTQTDEERRRRHRDRWPAIWPNGERRRPRTR